MGFLIKSAFWLSLVLLIIPIDVSEQRGDQPAVGPIDAFFAAREAVGDIGGMCERKPYVCDVGRSAVQTITLKARETIRIAGIMLDEEPVANPVPQEVVPTQDAAPQPEVDIATILATQQ